MKRTTYFFKHSTPENRRLVLADTLFLVRFCDLNVEKLNDTGLRVKKDVDYIHRVCAVLERERELQCARMCAFDPTRVKVDAVVHMDCNVLRIWPDMGIAELIKYYTYKAAIMREFAAARWAMGDRHGAHNCKLERREYEQALIKLKRERDRRKRVYNLS